MFFKKVRKSPGSARKKIFILRPMRFSFFRQRLLFVARAALAGLYRLAFLLLKKTVYRKRDALKARIVIVGSFLSGGAGKTPLVREFANALSEKGLRVAVLCHSAAWDEFRMLRETCRASVLKTRNRYATAQRISQNFDVILCDGGLEDTRFAGTDVFALRWNESAQKLLDLIPCGKCVSLEKDHPEAKEIFCSRTADNLYATESGKLLNENSWTVSFGISTVQNADGRSLPAGVECSLVTGIGDPVRFAKDVESLGLLVSKRVFLPDHFRGFAKVLRRELLKGLPVVITEKDFSRLENSEKENPRLFVAREKVLVGSALADYLNALAGGAFKNPPSTL
jgi:tetraacyldisaccharide 4'-kinase